MFTFWENCGIIFMRGRKFLAIIIVGGFMGGTFTVKNERVLVDQKTGESMLLTEELTSVTGYVPYLNMTKSKLVAWLISSGMPQDKVRAYVVKETRNDNLLMKTVEEIAKATGTGKNTVVRTLDNMAESDLIKYISHGKWMVNPEFFCPLKKGLQEKLQAQYNSICSQAKRPNKKGEV